MNTFTSLVSASHPKLGERLGLWAVNRYLRSIRKGHLKVQFPDGSVQRYGPPDAPRQATITFSNFRALWRIALRGSIGFGESYVAKEWQTDDLVELISILLECQEFGAESKLQIVRPMRWIQRLGHALRRNSIKGSRRNIHEHYDLGNDFFSLLLDPSMTYSSAVYEYPEQPLFDAQMNKVRRVLDKAQVMPGDRLLEIGSGWGTLAVTAAREYGARVTTLTVSEEQYRYVQERIAREKLQGQVEVLFCDYRSLQGTFDKIVSVEMLEAVGRQYLGTFFAVCDRLLAPHGMAVVQVICMLDQWYAEYCSRTDWIQTYIFPGSHLPALSALLEAIDRNSTFNVEAVENIAPHYARTLREWRMKLMENTAKLRALRLDEQFQRMFEFYLASCEAEFGTRLLMDYQIVLTKPNNPRLLAHDARTIHDRSGKIVSLQAQAG